MTNISKKIVFFGTEDFSLGTLTKLIETGYQISAVVTKPDSKKGRGQTLIPPAVKVFAEQHDIPVWQPSKLAEITELIRSLQPVVGILVSYGKIIPQSIIDLFDPGIINVHPSLLPRYRGPSPVETAILQGDSETGISIMQLSAKMDAGPVYQQRAYIKVTAKDALYNNLSIVGSEMLAEALPLIVDGSIVATPQDDAEATYCRLIQKSDGVIDWTKPADVIEREINAYSGWPGSRMTLGGVDVIVTVGRSVYPVPYESSTAGTPYVYTDLYKSPNSFTTPTDEGDSVNITSDYPLLYVVAGKEEAGLQTYLEIVSLKPLGKKEMSAREFINGYGHLLEKGEAS